MVNSPRLLEANRVCKAFPGVRALDEVHLALDRGEILCVVGENGAGKSTLMKILGGVCTADSGEIRIDGREVQIISVDQAQRLGITLIHQELNLAQSLDVAGNMFLGREPQRGGWLRLIDGRIYSDAVAIMERLGLACSPRTSVSRLSIGQQQLVEIGRALSLDSRILIMDEPTSSLTQRDTARLFQVIRALKLEGVSILYISHRLAEVQEIADRVLVLRDGRNAGVLSKAEISHSALVRLMVGRELKQFFHSPAANESLPAAPAVFEAKGLRVAGQPGRPIDFSVGRGEVVGMAGLMGAGRTELAESIFGVRPLEAGEIRVDGRRLRLRSPADAIAAGIFLIPEDRRLQGLVLSQTVRENISISSFDRVSRFRLVLNSRERELADRMCRLLNVRTPSIEQVTALLSGGNQQKVVLARWLARAPKLLILDEPTRGIDVGAKAEIYGLMRDLARQGVGVLMISSDMEEILGVADRVLVMHQGNLAGGLTRSQMSEQAVMQLATGGPATA